MEGKLTDARQVGQRAASYLKSELKRAEITYEELAKRLSLTGIPETQASVASKLARGTFSAQFWIAALLVVGRKNVDLDNLS